MRDNIDSILLQRFHCYSHHFLLQTYCLLAHFLQVGSACAKRVLILLNLEKEKPEQEKPRAMPPTYKHSILYKRPGSKRAAVVEETRKEVTSTVATLWAELKRHAQDGVIAGVPQVKDCRHPTFESDYLKPAVKASLFLVFPTLFRGLVETPQSVAPPNKKDFIEATSMPAIIRLVRDGLRGTRTLGRADADALCVSSRCLYA